MVVPWDEFTLTFRPYWILQLFVGGVHLALLLRERTPQLQAQCTLVATHTVEKSQPCDARRTTSCAPTLLFTISYELLVLALQLPVFTRLPLKGLAFVLPNPSSWKTSDASWTAKLHGSPEDIATLLLGLRSDGLWWSAAGSAAPLEMLQNFLRKFEFSPNSFATKKQRSLVRHAERTERKRDCPRCVLSWMDIASRSLH